MIEFSKQLNWGRGGSNRTTNVILYTLKPHKNCNNALKQTLYDESQKSLKNAELGEGGESSAVYQTLAHCLKPFPNLTDRHYLVSQ